MPGINALLAHSSTVSVAHSALPGAPVVAAEPAKVAAPRRAAASGLRTLADRLAPEPVERSRWQGA